MAHTMEVNDMNSFSSVSILALFCYLVLFLAMAASKKTKVIKSFMIVLFTMILWTGGSYLMRSEIDSLFTFGFHISVLGLCLIPYAFYIFFRDYLSSKKGIAEYLWLVFFMILFVINVKTGYFLKEPVETILKSGDITYVYQINLGGYLLCGSFLLFIISSLVKLTKTIRDTKSNVKELYPIFLGIAILFIGNALVLTSIFEGFPIDIVAGLINAILLFYALYRRRLFRLTLLASRGNCYVVAGLITLIIFSNLIKVIQRIIFQLTGLNPQYSVMIVSVCFTAVTTIVYFLFKKFIDQVFIKDEIKQAENLKMFSHNVSKTLKVNDIIEQMAEIINETLTPKSLYICLKGENNECTMVYGNSPFTYNSYTFQKDNPLIMKLEHSDDVILYSEFKHSISYRSMWDDEKKRFESLDIELIVPIRTEHLTGMIMLSKKSNHSRYSYEENNFLVSLASISAIALKNSKMYEKVYLEARTDELTGLINRKYFYECLNEAYDNRAESPLTLILVSIDDVRLYNQLYGNKEGDIALKNIANIMQNYVESQGKAARLGGKEFAIILPNYNLMEAKVLAESIREEIENMNKKDKAYTLKSMTASFGISSIPFSANNINQLIEYANQALYQAKRKGKNCVAVFNEQVSMELNSETKKDGKRKESIYLEYAPTIYALTAAIDAKDHYTFTHSANVAYYSTQLGYACNFSEDLVEIIKEAALLHDIGKIAIPENILNKSGALSEEEYEIMKSHVEASIGIIRHLPSLDYVIPAVLSHHERYDGQGYPRGIKGEDIPLLGRILCIADSFDAMTSSRSYKEPYSIEYSISELERNKGSQFDPKLVDTFISLINEGKVNIQGNEKADINII